MSPSPLLPAYLMVGADELKRAFLVDRLTQRVAALGDPDFNRDVFQGPAATADEVIAACNTLPFMSECRLVLVKDVDKAPKALAEALVAYLADPSPTTVLACTATKLAKNTRLYKAFAKVDKKAVVSCEPKSKRDLPAQVRDLALSNGVDLDLRCADQLIALVGESTVRLDTEIKKMAAALGPGAQITPAHLERYVTRTSEVKPWELVDALSARDGAKALLLLSRMPGQSPFGLLAMTLNRIRELLIARELDACGQGNRLASELGVPDWRVRNHRHWAAAFAPGELEHLLVSAADLERSMKSGGDAQQLFERWALGMACGV